MKSKFDHTLLIWQIWVLHITMIFSMESGLGSLSYKVDCLPSLPLFRQSQSGLSKMIETKQMQKPSLSFSHYLLSQLLGPLTAYTQNGGLKDDPGELENHSPVHHWF